MPEYISDISIESTPCVYDRGINSPIQKIDKRVRLLRSQGKLTPEALQRIQKYFRIRTFTTQTLLKEIVLIMMKSV